MLYGKIVADKYTHLLKHSSLCAMKVMTVADSTNSRAKIEKKKLEIMRLSLVDCHDETQVSVMTQTLRTSTVLPT